MTTGPFKDLLLPHDTAKANALHVLRNYVSTYLITHPHLDHLSGFAINTAAFQHTTRPKKLAALPHTISAVKAHVFNDTIWPNLSDEEGGVGLVSFQRLTEGGNLALGEGDGRGYIEVCDGLAVKGWTVSHGKCMKQHGQRGSVSQEFSFAASGDGRRGSRSSNPLSPGYRRKSLSHSEVSLEPSVVDSSAFFILDERSGKEILFFGDVEPDSISLYPRTHRVWADAAPKIAAGLLSAIFIECSYDDSQPDEMLFGHLNPRHLIAELSTLAEKVTNFRNNGNVSNGGGVGSATSLSHPSQASLSDTDPRKRKHNGPHFLLEPPIFFGGPASEPQHGRTPSPLSPRKAASSSVSPGTRWSHSSSDIATEAAVPPHFTIKSTSPARIPLPASHMQTRSNQTSPRQVSPRQPNPRENLGALNLARMANYPSPAILEATSAESAAVGGKLLEIAKPLVGVKLVAIHIKDTMKDGPPAAEVVLAQLKQRAEAAGLGCEVLVAKQGEALYL